MWLTWSSCSSNSFIYESPVTPVQSWVVCLSPLPINEETTQIICGTSKTYVFTPLRGFIPEACGGNLSVESPPRLPDPFLFTRRGHERVELGEREGGNIRMTERERKTKWRSGLAWRKGSYYGERGMGGGGAFMEMPQAFCSARMEKQPLIRGWTWGEGPGTKHPFDREPHRSPVEMWGSLVEPCQTHRPPAFKDHTKLNNSVWEAALNNTNSRETAQNCLQASDV